MINTITSKRGQLALRGFKVGDLIEITFQNSDYVVLISKAEEDYYKEFGYGLFNTKTRVITEYVTNSAKGFEVSGTTLKNIDTSSSRSTRLRKPDAFLPIILKKTANQINKEWQSLTTKTTVPNGRINKDTVLLRVLDK